MPLTLALALLCAHLGSGFGLVTRHGAKAYTYDNRGNRNSVSDWTNSWNIPETASAGAPKDRLGSWGPATGKAWKYDYTYDATGNVLTKVATEAGLLTSLQSNLALTPGTGNGAATDSVYKATTFNGVAYSYYYDWLTRRRAKVYPINNLSDEYFYSLDGRLLVDQGNQAIDAAVHPYYPVDEYVWLGGQPVVLFRSSVDAKTSLHLATAAQSDVAGTCGRNGDSTPCGIYFPVTDPFGKPVVMLDSSYRIAGLADYEPYGAVNRVMKDAESAHPYTADTTLASTPSLAMPSLDTWVRAKYQAFQLRGTSFTVGANHDDVLLYDGSSTSTTVLDTGVGSSGRDRWSAWVKPSTGMVTSKLATIANPTAYKCNASFVCSFVADTTFNKFGAVLSEFEYQRAQTGVTPFWTPLRFPGQYFDAETELVQNWYRFYDQKTGRYLEPEPMWRSPAAGAMVASGRSTLPAYAYAAGNPVGKVDPDGLGVLEALVSGFMWGVGVVWPGAHAGIRLADTYTGSQYVMYVENHPFQPSGVTTTYGYAVCSDSAISKDTWAHETQHIKQEQAIDLLPFPLNELYLPAHLGFQGYSALRSGTYDQYNPLETGPYARQWTGQGGSGDNTDARRPWPWH